MLAMCARVAPADMRAPALSNFTCSFLSCCSTEMPLATTSDNSPLAPFTFTTFEATEAVTPCGRSTGRFATPLMLAFSSSGHDAEPVPALPDGPRLLVGHHALGRGDDGSAETTLDLRNLG